MSPKEFFANHPVFTIEEFSSTLPGRKSATIFNSLNYHTKQGHIARIKRGLYYSVTPGHSPDNYPVDPYLIAGKAAPDAILAYHTALSYHGVAYSVREHFNYLTNHIGSRSFEFRNTIFNPTEPPSALISVGQQSFAINKIDRQGLTIRVTSLERTLVDVLDRLDLSGGIEEVWKSLNTISYLNIKLLIEYTLMLNNATTVGKVGLFLQQHQKQFLVKSSALNKLQKSRPAQPQYMLRQKRKGIVVPDWNLVVPKTVLERSWEEPHL